MKLSKEVNDITRNIEQSKTALNNLIKGFDSQEFNDERFEELKKGVSVVNQDCCQKIDEYNSSLIDNKKYTFLFDESSIEDIFGRLIDSVVRFFYS